jgi:hypothetical protein
MTTDIYQEPGPSDAPPRIIPDAPFRPSIPDKPRPTTAEIDRTQTSAVAAQLNVAARDETARLILGRCRVGAVIPWATVSGGELIIMCIWGRSGPEGYDAVETISMNDAALPAGSTVTHYLGNQTTADPLVAALLVAYGLGSFTNALTGVCWSLVQLPERDYSSGFPGGYSVNLGPLHAVIRGLKCYDPRDGAQVYATPSTWLWTNNPALITARVITDATLGLGVAPTTDFWTSVTAAANYDDAAPSGAPGGSKRFTLNMALQENAPADTHIKVLASYGGFWAVPDAGSFKFVIDGVTTAGATITRANMIAGAFSARGIENKDRPNLVFVRYTEPPPTNVHAPWVTRVAPQGADIPALPSGETRRVSDIDMPGFTSYDQALRYAKERRAHFYTEDIVMSFQMPQTGLALFKGDVRPVTYGVFTAKEMRCLDARPNRLGYWDTDWQEYDPAAYSNTWVTAPTTPDTVLPDPFAAPASVTGLTLAEVLVTGESSSAPLSAIDISWTASTSPYVIGYNIEITDDGTTPVAVHRASVQGLAYRSPPLTSPNKYRVFVAPYNAANVVGAFANESITLRQTSQRSETVFTEALTSTGWLVYDTVGQTGLSFETADFSSTNPTYERYHGASEPPDMLLSPVYDLGSRRACTLSLAVFEAWADTYRDSLRGYLVIADEDGVFYDGPAFDGSAMVTARYFQLRVAGVVLGNYNYGGANFGQIRSNWKINLTGGEWVAKMPVQIRAQAVTTNPSALLTVTLDDRYLKFSGANLTAESTDAVTASYSSPYINERKNNRIDIATFDAAGAFVSRDCTLTVYGVLADATRTDWCANGATATATSGTNMALAIDGELDSAVSGFWATASALPQTLTVDLFVLRPITEWVVIFLKDAFGTPGQPTVFDVATLYHATSFTIEGWNGSAWITEQTITGNTKVMRRFPASASYSKGRCTITASPDGGSRITEFLMIGPA